MDNQYYNNRKLLLSGCYIVAGGALWVLAILGKVPGEYLGGIGGGLFFVGVLQVYRNLKYRNNEAFHKKIDIAAGDERNRYIRSMAWSWTGYLMVLGLAVISLVMYLTGQKQIAQILSICMCAELVIYYVSYIVLGKKN